MKNLSSLMTGLVCLLLASCSTDDESGGLSSPVKQSRELVQELDEKGLIIKDGEINSYIQNLGYSITQDKNFKFYVVRDPQINAYATADKSIIINLGLIARTENELQLAQIISHEIGHSVKNHVEKAYESQTSKVQAAHIMDLALFGTGIAYIPFAASIASYSQDRENEADEFSIQKLSELGYDLNHSTRLFEILHETKNNEFAEGSMWSSHPGDNERIETIKNLISSGKYKVNNGGKVNTAEHAQIKRLAVIQNNELKLISRQYSLAIESLESELKLDNQNPNLHYLLGESYRKMAEDPDGAAKENAWINDEEYSDELKKKFEDKKSEYLAAAKQSFGNALICDPNFVDAYKGLGLVKRTLGDDSYKVDLATYLNNKTNAFDTLYVTKMLNTPIGK